MINLDKAYIEGGAIVFGLILSVVVMYIIAIGIKTLLVKSKEKKQRKEYAIKCAEMKKQQDRMLKQNQYAEFVALASRYEHI